VKSLHRIGDNHTYQVCGRWWSSYIWEKLPKGLHSTKITPLICSL